MTQLYKEERDSPLIWLFVLMAGAIITLIFLFPEEDDDPVIISAIIAGMFTFLVLAFRKYKVIVDNECVRLRYGIISSNVKISEITSFNKKKLSKWFTFGMKTDLKNFYYIGAMGREGIEMKTSKGKYYLFTTQHPDRVIDAIRTASSKHS